MPVRIDRAARPDRLSPPAGLAGDRVGRSDVLVAGQGVGDQDGVGAIGVQPAIGAVGDLQAMDHAPGIKRKRAVTKARNAFVGHDPL